MNSTVAIQRAYHTRRTDIDNSIWSQEEAERKALEVGDHGEALACRNRARALKTRARQNAQPKDFSGMTKSLGGERDPISIMLVSGKLDIGQARAALIVRDYFENETITLSGGDNMTFVDGGKSGGMEDKIHARLVVGDAWRKAMAKVTLGDGAQVQAIILGRHSVREAAKRRGGNTARTCGRLTSGVSGVLLGVGRLAA